MDNRIPTLEEIQNFEGKYPAIMVFVLVEMWSVLYGMWGA
jgi:hypothetical protein